MIAIGLPSPHISFIEKQEASEEPFDISSVPKEVKSQPRAEKKAPGKKPSGLGAPTSGPTLAVDAYEKLLSTIPEFSGFGELFKVSQTPSPHHPRHAKEKKKKVPLLQQVKNSIQIKTSIATEIFCPFPQSSAPVELTEAETEYAVNVVKHIYDGHVVFQYNCSNTIPEQLLENVRDGFHDKYSLLIDIVSSFIIFHFGNVPRSPSLLMLLKLRNFQKLHQSLLEPCPMIHQGRVLWLLKSQKVFLLWGSSQTC